MLKSLGVVNGVFTRMPQEFCCYTTPGYTAQVFITDEPLGLLGELHPNVLGNYDLKQTAYIFELNFDLLLEQIPTLKSARPLPKFPATSRDITLIVDKNVEALKILKCVETLDEDLVESLHLFDVFEGDPTP